MNSFNIRKAKEEDAPLILEFIKGLAGYEKLSGEVTATTEQIKETLFGDSRRAECIIGFAGGKPVAFAIYFFNYSTFLGKYGLYLEDLFVLPEERGKGYGKKMLKYLAGIAVENNCGRFEWSVLNWNEPAIKFYKNLGAVPQNEWTLFRITGEPLKKLAEGF